jgi:ribose 5-phosphate isomerase B
MIAIGCDHAAYSFKTEILQYLKDKGYEVKDFGSDGMAKSDYPEYARRVCRSIQAGECDRGLLFCGTGIGMSITANKFRGIRAAACMEALGAELSRRHNDANVLCLGARMIGPELAKRTVDVWLETDFEGGRHQNRVNLIALMENEEHTGQAN